MSQDDTNDRSGSDESRITETAERFQLNYLAEMLDAPVEKVREWLASEGIQPVSPDYPEDYGMDAMEYVRLRRHQF